MTPLGFIRPKHTPLIMIALAAILVFLTLSSCGLARQVTPIFEAPPGTVPPTGISVGPEDYTIAEIQGAAHISPYLGETVSGVGGLVTAVTSTGFYLQSLTPDQDPATSEGIFVFTGTIPRVAVGDGVAVDGRVVEFTPGGVDSNLSRTQLVAVTMRVFSSGNDLPEPTLIGKGGRMPPTQIIDNDTAGLITASTYFDPENDGLDFYESLEGMLVEVQEAVVVGPTNKYKEVVILANKGLWAGVRTPRGGIVIQPGDNNPERIILDDLLVQMPWVNVGDIARDPIVGVMDYDFGNFKLLPTDPPEFEGVGLSPEEGIPPAAEGELRMASYNVLNLSAGQTDRISVLAGQIVNQMGAPDIIGLQEIMDNDGDAGDDEVSADQTYQGIIDAILDLGGPQYGFADIDPGPGGDGGIPMGNIRVGFLYRNDTGLRLLTAPHGDAGSEVEILNQGGDPTPTLNPGRVDPNNPAFTASRRPLLLTFDYRGERLFVINNHFVSKGPDSPMFGAFQPPVLDSEGQRLGQALAVHDFVADILAVDPDAHVVVMGDLNDFHFSKAINLLEGEILENLVERLPIPEQYSYIHDGNSQVLDQILITRGLSPFVAGFDILHLNSDLASNSRFSDHDPVIVRFDFVP